MKLRKICLISGMLIAGCISAIADDRVRLDDDDDYDDDLYGPTKGDWELTLGGSGSNDTDFDSGGGGLAGSLGYFLTDDFEVAFRQSFIYTSGPGNSSWNGASRGVIDYHFDLDRVRPFVGASLGYAYGDGVTETWYAGLEGGAKFYVKDETFIFIMGEYQWFFKDAGRADNNFDDGALAYSAGIGFNF